MRYKKMTPGAERDLRREVSVEGLDRKTAHAERDIEQRRKRALRASWLDLRNPAAVRERSNALAVYNLSLRTHLVRFHPDAVLPESPWELDALHEELHARS